jgi:hypothetical protein
MTKQGRAFRGRRRAQVAAAALLSTLSASAQPQATSPAPVEPGPEPVRLVYTRSHEAEACPESSVIEADVTARLGENPFRSDARDSIDVRVGREHGEWSALIEERTGGGPPAGSRVVTSSAESCDSLAAAVGLAIALMIRARSNPEPAPAKPVAPCVATTVAPTAPPCAKDERKDERHVGVFANVIGAIGILPRAALGASVLGRVPFADEGTFAVGLSFLPEQRTSAASGEFGFGATFAEVAGCYGIRPAPRMRFSACAALLFGALHVVVADPVPVDTGARFWGAAAAGLNADFAPAGPLHFLLSVEGAVPFERYSYEVELEGRSETVFEQPRFATVMSAGIGVEL